MTNPNWPNPDGETAFRFIYPSTDDLTIAELERRLSSVLNLAVATTDLADPYIAERLGGSENVHWDTVTDMIRYESKIRELSYHTPLLITIAFGAFAAVGLGAIIHRSVSSVGTRDDISEVQESIDKMSRSLNEVAAQEPGAVVEGLRRGDEKTWEFVKSLPGDGEEAAKGLVLAAEALAEVAQIEMVQNGETFELYPREAAH